MLLKVLQNPSRNFLNCATRRYGDLRSECYGEIRLPKARRLPHSDSLLPAMREKVVTEDPQRSAKLDIFVEWSLPEARECAAAWLDSKPSLAFLELGCVPVVNAEAILLEGTSSQLLSLKLQNRFHTEINFERICSVRFLPSEIRKYKDLFRRCSHFKRFYALLSMLPSRNPQSCPTKSKQPSGESDTATVANEVLLLLKPPTKASLADWDASTRIPGRLFANSTTVWFEPANRTHNKNRQVSVLMEDLAAVLLPFLLPQHGSLVVPMYTLVLVTKFEQMMW